MTRNRLAVLLTGAALVAVPATANAGSVSEHVADGRTAVVKTYFSALEGKPGATARQAGAVHRAQARAERAAKRISQPRRRAAALKRVAGLQDYALDSFASGIDEVPASVQEILAIAIGDSVAARERVVAVLTRLAEKLPEPARTALLEAVARFHSDGEIEALLQALASEDVSAGVKVIVAGHVEHITGVVNDVLDRLDGIADGLPPQAGDAVRGAIAMVREHLAHVSALIDEIFAGLPGGIGGLPGGGGLGSICDLLGGLPIPLPICD